jgi:SAM-dependent methyltransferase
LRETIAGGRTCAASLVGVHYARREMVAGDEAQTWHHGLVARWWAEFNLDGPEIAYFKKFIEDDGQPALDLACGTGRLLVPYLRAGLDVDGCDLSADMLALCRERAKTDGLSPNLFTQAMHELDLPRKYKTIVVCGGFGLGGNREQGVESLRRIYEHLEPGGLLLLDNEVPYAHKGLWTYWLEEERAALPRPWRELEDGDRRQGSDGAEYALRSRVVELDPLAQCVRIEMRADLWRDGEHLATEEHVLRMSLYFAHELAALLKLTGFIDVALHADYTDEEAGPDTDFVVFIARKPA